MASVVSINISKEKGSTKKPISQSTIETYGLTGDAHAGAWHRQVSLLSSESIERFSKQCGRTFNPGDFAENLTTTGLDLSQARLLDRLVVGEAVLEVSQIGKVCHEGGCTIFKQIGTCVMPKEGIFCRVLKPGRVRPGDAIMHELHTLPILIATLSDRASSGVYEDQSGALLKQRLTTHFQSSQWRASIELRLIPDDRVKLAALIEEAKKTNCRVLMTTGGTGLGPHDITPDVIRPLLDREIPGIMEYIRVKHSATLPGAMLSRSLAGLIGNMLVYVLPGSKRAVDEYLDVILTTLDHSLRMIAGFDLH
jgi:molybdopterin adenylyltransferase